MAKQTDSKSDSALDGIKSKLKDQYFDIENNDSLSIDEKVSRIINYTSAGCAAVAIQPIPFADVFILTPIQAYMGTRIANIYGINIKEQDGIKIVKQIGGTVGLGFLAQQLAIGAYKTVLPFLGAVTTIPLVYGLTYGIGQVMDVYFKNQAEGKKFDKQEMKNIWKEKFREGKKQGEERENEIRSDDEL